MTTGSTRPAYWAFAKGPLATIFLAAVLSGVYVSPLRSVAPFPIAILAITVIYSVFSGGVISGFVSSAISCLYVYIYVAYGFNSPSVFASHLIEAWVRTSSWGFSLTLMVWIVGILKRRSNELEGVRMSRTQSEELLGAIPYLIWSADAEGAVTTVNDRWEKYTGLNALESGGWAWLTAVHRDDVGVLERRWRECLESKKPLDFEGRLRGDDSVHRWFWLRAEPIFKKDGRLEKWITTLTDIDSRKQNETELLLQKNRAELMLRNVGAVIWSTDAAGTHTFIDGSGLKRLNLKPNELVGVSLFQLYKDHPEFIAKAHAALVGQEAHFSLAFREFWFEVFITPMRDARGDIIGLSGLSIDVTERIANEKTTAELRARDQASQLIRESQKQVETANAKLQALINASPIAICALDETNTVSVWNPACEKLFGWSEQEALGQPLPFVTAHHQAESQDIITRMHKTREAIFFEADRERRDGSQLRLGVAAMPLFKSDGLPGGLMAVMTDITERARFEKNILETNRALEAATRAKSDFLANMSHEIRTPLNGVIGMTGLILDTELSTDQREYAEAIRTSGDNLLTLVNDILDFSKIEAGKIEIETIEFNVVQLIANIERTLAFAAEKKGVSIVTKISPALKSPRWKGDPTRIGQVLLNLANNAVKFTSSGTVTIEVSPVSEDASHERLRFEVRDTGIGIPTNVMPRLFQAFTQADASTTRKFGGTGLGLSICKSLVTLMNGEIGASSQPNQGSQFWFSLMLEAVMEARPEPKAIPEMANVCFLGDRAPRILIAEDNAVNQKIAIKMLEKFGFRVDAVANGSEALQALQNVPYDLVLMDCQMPEVDGFEATERLRRGEVEGLEAIPIVAMTANAMEGDREKCLKAGMNDYVTKPVSTEDLYQVVVRNLGFRTAS